MKRFSIFQSFQNNLIKVKEWSFKDRKHQVLVTFLIIVLLLPIAALITSLFKSPVEAAWFDAGYSFRRRIDLTSISASTTDYQVKISLDTSTLITAGKMQSDCDDIRIVDNTGKLLPFWIESGTNACNTASSFIWTKVPNVLTTGSTIYIYYGNPSATNYQNGSNVFEFFDDFSSGSLGSTWTASGAYSFSGGELTITTGSIYSSSTVTSTNINRIFEMRAKWAATAVSYAGITIGNAQSVGPINSNLNKVSFLVSNANTNINQQAYSASGAVASYDVVSNAFQYTPTANTYYISGLAHDSSNVRFYQNRTQTNSYSGAVSFTPYLTLGRFDGSLAGTTDITDITIDFVLSRKLVSTEPTVTLASEEVGSGPVGYWAMDEVTGGQTVYDSTFNANHGTLGANSSVSTDDPTYATEEQCVWKRCLKFDGSNDIVNVPDPSNGTLDFGTGSFSMNFWFRTSSNNVFPVSKRSSATAAGFEIFVSTNGQVQARLGDGTTNIATTTNAWTGTNDGKWHHVAMVVNRGNNTVSLYGDGLFKASVSISTLGSTSNSTPIQFGVRSGVPAMNGFLDEVKIYGYARTLAQVQSDYNLGAESLGLKKQSELINGLVGYWKMDETSWSNNCSTRTVTDTTNSTNGGGSSCPSSSGVTTLSAGKFGNSPNLDGVNDYISISGSTILDLTSGSATIAAWINPINTSSTYGIAGKENGTLYGYGIYTLSNGVRLEIVNSSQTITTDCDYTGGALTSGVWSHVAGTVETTGTGANLKVYINGQLVQSCTSNGSIGSASSNFLIGATNGGTSNFFPGKIDELRVYNRSLNGDQINSLYSFAPTMVGWWKLDENTGTSALDSSGNGVTGTINGGTRTSGKYGGGVSYTNGTDDITFTSNNMSPYTGTISFWFKPSVSYGSANSQVQLLGRGNGGATNDFYLIKDGTDTYAGINAGADEFISIPSATIAPYWVANTWVYFTFAYDIPNKDIFIYANNTLIGSNTNLSTWTTWTPPSTWYIGSKDGSSSAVQGVIDDIRVYNYIRTSSQIYDDMYYTAASNIAGLRVAQPLLHYKFDEMSGSTVNNSGSLGTAFTGSASDITWNKQCQSNSCINLNSSTSTVSAGDIDQIDGATAMTISFWVNPSSVSIGNTYISKSSTVLNRMFSIQAAASTSDLVVSIANSSTDSGNFCTTAGLGLTDFSWAHLTIVYEGTRLATDRIKVYKNGLLVTCNVTGTIPQTLTSGTSSSLKIGKGDGSAMGVIGQIDEFKLYNIALTSFQVAEDYNLGSALVLGKSSRSEDSMLQDTEGAQPIAMWSMDENTGTTTADKSGNSNNGTFGASTAAPTWTQGKFGGGIQFDGSNDYITISTGSPLSFERTNSYTINFWVNPNITRSGGNTPYRILSKRSTVGTAQPGWEVLLVWDGSKTIARVNLISDVGASNFLQASNTQDIPNNSWTHITVTYNGSSQVSGVKFYINGILDTTTSTMDALSGSILTANSLLIGTLNNVQNYYNGKLDQIMIYNYVRTQSQIMYNYNRGGPFLWWKFDECQGSTANNSSGNSNSYSGTITIGGSGTQTALGTCNTPSSAWGNGATGKFNSGINFDGTDDYVSSSSVLNLANQSFTISGWVYRTTNDATYDYVVSYGNTSPNTNENVHLVYIPTDEIRCGFFGNDLTSTRSFPDLNTWVHLACTYDATTNSRKIYRNGILVASDTSSNDFSGTGTNLYVGRSGFSGSASDHLPGRIDDIRVYNYQLSQSQLQQVYNGGAVRFGPATGSP